MREVNHTVICLFYYRYLVINVYFTTDVWWFIKAWINPTTSGIEIQVNFAYNATYVQDPQDSHVTKMQLSKGLKIYPAYVTIAVDA